MLLYFVFIVLVRACRVGICCSVFILLLYRISLSLEMSRLTRDGTAKPVLRDQILRREERGQGNINFPCSADHVQEWQPYPVDPYSLFRLARRVQPSRPASACSFSILRLNNLVLTYYGIPPDECGVPFTETWWHGKKSLGTCCKTKLLNAMKRLCLCSL